MNRLVQCEALEGLADIPSESIPLVVTSPPWGKTRIYGGHPFDFEPVAEELWRVIATRRDRLLASPRPDRGRLGDHSIAATNSCTFED